MTLLEKMMPRSDDFFVYFEAQAATAVEGAVLLKALLDDFTDVQKKARRSRTWSTRPTTSRTRPSRSLYTNFITPFDRSEIHELLSRIDDVLDLTDAAAERLSLYDLDQSIPEARELAGILVAQTRKMEEAVKGLRDMKKDPTRILEACKEINVIENQADTLTRKTMAMLFKRGNDPLHVMKWKEIIDFIETATDRAEDVANIIEGVVLEHA